MYDALVNNTSDHSVFHHGILDDNMYHESKYSVLLISRSRILFLFERVETETLLVLVVIPGAFQDSTIAL